MTIKISIITVCLNEVSSIQKTIESVLNQDYPDKEYIILDGGSTDGTIDIIKSYQHGITYFASEKDSGIYDAMNKSISIASGDILYFLNADDFFYNDQVLSTVAKIFMQFPECDILSGKVLFFNTPTYNGVAYERTNFRFKNKLELYERPNCQQCIFTKKSLYSSSKIGLFNTRYPMSADYEWLIRAINKKTNIAFVDNIFANFDYTGISYTQNAKRLKEKHRIILFNSSLFEIVLFLIKGIKQKLKCLKT